MVDKYDLLAFKRPHQRIKLEKGPAPVRAAASGLLPIKILLGACDKLYSEHR